MLITPPLFVISMFFKKKGLPKVGELVICTVTKILPHAAFVSLDDYERLDAMLHVSEVSSRWVRNIKDYVSEGKKIVCKILQIDEVKQHVDVSLKRVTNAEKTNKLNEEKIGIKVEKLIEVIAKKLNTEPAKALSTVGKSLIDYFESLADFYDLAKKEGIGIIDEVEIPAEWKKELKQAVQELLDAMKVNIQKEFELCSFEPDGINRIKNVFTELDGVANEKGVKVNLSYISSPHYKLNFTAKNYKEGDLFLQELINKLGAIASKNKVCLKC